MGVELIVIGIIIWFIGMSEKVQISFPNGPKISGAVGGVVVILGVLQMMGINII